MNEASENDVTMSHFFGFDSNVPSLGAGKFDDLEPELPDDEDIDDVNDETFGAGAVFGGDWEVEHEKLAEELEHFKYGVDGHLDASGHSGHGRIRNSSLREDENGEGEAFGLDLSNNYTSQEDDLEKSLSQLVVDDDDIDDPAIMNLSKNRPIPQVPSYFPQAKNANLDNLFGPSSPPAFLNTEHLVSPGKTNIWGSPVTRESYMEPTPPKEDAGIKNLLSMLQGPPKPHHQQPFRDPSIVMAGKPTPLHNARSVDELEKEMIGGGMPIPGMHNKPGGPLTVEELEREMRGQPIPIPSSRPGQPPHQHPVGTPPHGQYIQQNIKARAPPITNAMGGRVSGSPGQQHFSSSPHAPGYGHTSVPITIAKRGTPPPPGFHQAKRSPLNFLLQDHSPLSNLITQHQTNSTSDNGVRPPTPYPRQKLPYPFNSFSPNLSVICDGINGEPRKSYPDPCQKLTNGDLPHTPTKMAMAITQLQNSLMSRSTTPPVCGAAMINAKAPGNCETFHQYPLNSRSPSPQGNISSSDLHTLAKARPMLSKLIMPRATSPIAEMSTPGMTPMSALSQQSPFSATSTPHCIHSPSPSLETRVSVLSPEDKKILIEALSRRLLSPPSVGGSPADRPGQGPPPHIGGPGPKDRNLPPFLQNAPVQQRMPFPPGGFPNDGLRHRGPHPHQGPPPPRGHPMFNQPRPAFDPRFQNGPRPPMGERFPPPPPGERFPPPPDDRFGPPPPGERHQNGDFHGRHPGDHHMDRGRGGYNHMDRGRGFPGPRGGGGGGRGGFDGPLMDNRMGFDMRSRGPPPHDMRGRGGFDPRGRGRGFHHPGYRWRQNSIGEEEEGDRDGYSHLMTQKEKDWIIKIQLMQLHTSNPYLDDYYYTKWQMEKLFRERAAKSDKKGEPKLVLPQLAKLDSRLYKPVQFEGSLGRLTASSVHNPRQIIDVKVRTNTTEEEGRHKEVRRFKQLLINVEKSYDLLLDIDDVEKRAMALPEDVRPPLFKQRAEKIEDLYSRLYLTCKEDITLVQLLMVRKGAKLVARTVPFLSQDQAVCVVAAVFQNLPTIIRREQADEVMAQLFQSMARLITTLDLETLVILSGAFTPYDDTTNHLTSILQSKFGASLVWSVISRGEIIFRNTSPVDLDVASQKAWSSFVQVVGRAACQTPDLAQPFYIFPTVPAYLHRHLGGSMSGSMEERITSALTPCTPPATELAGPRVVQVSS